VHGSQKENLERALYVVATPIGNLRDITLRALDILGSVDVIAAEDTRTTGRLLSHYHIAANRLIALHQHNEREGAEKTIALLSEGKSVAFVTDAGTPGISDPGTLLVQAVRDAGYRVIPVPGANAVVAALSASGLASPHFLFYGFLPAKTAARRRELQALANLPYTLVFYEAPHRILECVADLRTIFGGNQDIVFARELTKLFENIHACTLDNALEWLNADTNNQRGEFVLMLSGNPVREAESNAETTRILSILLNEFPLKKAVQLAAQITGAGRNKLYEDALQLKQLEE
jgi:16S rRNA (cytidine1402-2'-O)-methyltransferase